MQLVLYGGFGEKGRTSLGVRTRDFHLLLDAGVKTSARGRADYVPAITPGELARIDAIAITHAHEDHVGALGWCLAHGFTGRIFMTAVTRAECEVIVAAYGSAGEARRVREARIEPLPDDFALGPLRIVTGRSGHIGGGVWCAVDDGAVRLGYCGDVVTASPVFAYDPLPACDALVLDASYADDAVPFAARAADIASWVRALPQGCVLPTPLFGRSLELFALLRPQVALAPGMRDALVAQIEAAAWLVDGLAEGLTRDLAGTMGYTPGAPWPPMPVLCHDGMGLTGPSREILALAQQTRHPVLLTGHVPDGSPGDDLLAAGAAQWKRLPTHPTLGENLALVRACAPRVVLGHSCAADGLARLHRHIPSLRQRAVTGDVLDLT
ncbi:MAG: MBL fold metallo-hydrolase [Burkholderiales bacterium]|nr:MBL fold metallo-hydrolase [Burkholderiales bacterium]